MNEREEPPYWTIDEELTELDLQESTGGPQRYSVRFKGHVETGVYDAKRTIYPLQHRGTQIEVTGKAYILVPDVTLTVGLLDRPVPSGAIGTAKGSEWRGMRHHEIAKARGLYFAEDHALALWEVDSFSRLDDFTHGQLWHAFEGWLTQHFPNAVRIFTDDDEPGDSRADNQEFLRSLGYKQATGTQRIFGKELGRS